VWWATGLVLVFALSLSDILLRIPVQPSDSVELMLDAQRSPSAAATFASTLSASGYMRPMFRAQNKLLFDIGERTSIQLVFRGFHALLLSAALLLFAHIAQVRTRDDFGAFAFALAVLIGLHTFRGAVGEAYPVNHYLNVGVICLATLALARSRGGVWADSFALVGFAYAILILETGALVWVIAVTAWGVGWRGISGRAVTLITGLLAAYLFLRFVYLPTGVPDLSERSSGFLFSVLDPPELRQRFGEQRWLFYAYNVAASALSVLFSEPRAGRFVALLAWQHDALPPRMLIAIGTSLVTTLLISMVAVRAWHRRALDDNNRFIVVFLVVLLANAAISFPYTKDEIMVPAGLFYALAAYGALRVLLSDVQWPRRVTAVAATTVLVLISLGWTGRAAGVPYFLRVQAFKHRGDWAELPGQWRRSGRWPTAPEAADLVERLRDDALIADTPNPYFEPRWVRFVQED
jgi:hypothetical protein